MLSYTFSRREKTLLVILAVILIVIAWFMLVFQRTNTEITSLSSEISNIQADYAIKAAQVNEMRAMEKAIEEKKAEGAMPKAVPTYDNLTPLMLELNSIMSQASTYSITFDNVDSTASNKYMLRGTRIDFSCDSFQNAEALVRMLATSTYPCSVDSVKISDSTTGSQLRVVGSTGAAGVSASVHVTFFEKKSR